MMALYYVTRIPNIPSSLTSVNREAANSIFCRTGAWSGTYVTAMNWPAPEGALASRRRMIYAAALSVSKGARFERSEEKSADVDWISGPGIRFSGEVEMLARRPRWEELERRDWKAVRSSWDAGGND